MYSYHHNQVIKIGYIVGSLDIHIQGANSSRKQLEFIRNIDIQYIYK
jgi:hypothetical protein